jgi:deoxyribonucleoside regulator
MDYLFKVARLYYLENMSQQQIANQLGISRAKVYRLLIKARESGVVSIELRTPVQDFSELEVKIEKVYGINQCIVVQSSDSLDIMMNGFRDALSNLLNNDLRDGMKLGIGWGRTIRGAVERLTLKEKSKVKVYPVIGGGGLVYDDIHANSIVSLIAGKLNATAYVLNCLAIIDSKLNKEILLKESYIEAVVKQFELLDMAVVPIGYVGPDITLYKAKHVSMDDLDFLKGLGVVGDINSNFIDAQGNLVENKIQDRIINVTLDSLKRIKNTVAICYGQEKAEAAKAALKSGAINKMIIDSKIAKMIIAS